MMGYECYSITGKTVPYDEESLHEWNIIRLNGNWYWVDTTWDEVYDENGEEIGVSKDYLLIDDEMLYIDHEPECDFDLPLCEDKSLFCLDDAGAYFDTYDINQIESKMKEWISKGYQEFHFKFLLKEDAQKLYDYIENEGFFNFYERNISSYYDLYISYSYNEDGHIVALYWNDLY